MTDHRDHPSATVPPLRDQALTPQCWPLTLRCTRTYREAIACSNNRARFWSGHQRGVLTALRGLIVWWVVSQNTIRARERGEDCGLLPIVCEGVVRALKGVEGM